VRITLYVRRRVGREGKGLKQINYYPKLVANGGPHMLGGVKELQSEEDLVSAREKRDSFGDLCHWWEKAF